MVVDSGWQRSTRLGNACHKTDALHPLRCQRSMVSCGTVDTVVVALAVAVVAAVVMVKKRMRRKQRVWRIVIPEVAAMSQDAQSATCYGMFVHNMRRPSA